MPPHALTAGNPDSGASQASLLPETSQDRAFRMDTGLSRDPAETGPDRSDKKQSSSTD
jgi:hypothetical protein